MPVELTTASPRVFLRALDPSVAVELWALVPVDPPRYGCGFWLAEPATGQGVASAAVGALVEYAARELAASDVFAGVTHGNSRSVAVLERSGFRRSDHFDTYDRFHRRLAE
jgi:RimJ/RimL family protein N-acetyltransferase